MTFKNLQDRVLERLNLTSADARTRVKNRLNERYRQVATSVGLQKVRFGTVTFPTVASQYTYDLTTAILTPNTNNVIHAMTLTYVAGRRVLLEKSLDGLRWMDPSNTRTGYPQFWARTKENAVSEQVYIWPLPDTIYTIQVDGILSGIDLSADSDVPVLPEDFHDVLEWGAMADEVLKMEKDNTKYEAKFLERLRELRYFIAKTAYLELRQGEQGTWWWGFWFGSYRG